MVSIILNQERSPVLILIGVPLLVSLASPLLFSLGFSLAVLGYDLYRAHCDGLLIILLCKWIKRYQIYVYGLFG